MKLELKVILLTLFASLVPVTIIAVLILWQTAQTGAKVDEEVHDLVKLSIDKICAGIYDMCEMTDELVQAQVNQSLNAARIILTGSDANIKSTGSGKVEVSEEKIGWDAINQVTRNTDHVLLPKMMVAGQWLGQNYDLNTRTPIIDEIIKVAGGTATIFQRMNESGDMLRVATSIRTLEGKRAIGTYIPAKMEDDSINPVISEVMQGKTFRGRAFVVNAWYLTAYEPIRDDHDTIIGMLYVGIKQDNIETLRKKILDTKVGSDGYAFVLGGKGNKKGTYIISKDGAQDGKLVLDSKQPDGSYFVREMIGKAMSAEKGACIFKSYYWKNPGETEPRLKISAVRYYEPWDWVIGTSIYQDDMAAASKKVASTISALLFWCLGGGTAVAILASILAALIGARFTRPISQITRVADSISVGDLAAASKTIKELSSGGQAGQMDGNEAEQLLFAINIMTQNLNSLIGKVQQSGIHITSSSTQIVASAKQLEATIADQASSTNEVLATTTEISGVSKELVGVMRKVAESASNTATKAGTGQTELAKMGGTMRELASSTHSISARLAIIDEKTDNVRSVVTTISKVADQTNLLSLNASIEAEKAGDYGRGFSVVAKEIQRLADQTAVAMMDIERIVGEMRSAVRTGVTEMDTFTHDVEDFVSEVSRINSVQEEIIEQVQDLIPAFKDVNEGMNSQALGAEQIRDAIVHLSEGAEQTSAALNEFRHTAKSLNEAARTLQDEISKFEISS